MEYDVDYEASECIRKGKLKKLKKLVSILGFQQRKNWQGGYVLLLWSLEHRRTGIAKWLLSQNCQVNPDDRAYSHQKKTALHLAVLAGKPAIVKLLLQRGARVGIQNDQLESPLHASCKRRGPSSSEWVFGGDGSLAIVKLLLKHGACVNDKGGLCEETPLLFAIRNRQQQDDRLVKLLLDSGANVNDCDLYRKTALHLAVEFADRRMIKLLLGHKADVNVKNCHGRTPLHLAVRRGCLDIAKMLLARGADVNDSVCDFEEYRWTALHMAVRNKDEKMVRTLLGYRADVNARDILGQVPFHLAIRGEDEGIVECLLRHGARVDSRRKDGKTCLHFAAENQRPRIARILLARGASVNEATINGRTALHFAAKRGSKELVELFLGLGMDVDLKTKLDDFTPLYYAVKKRRCQIAECLLYHGADVNVPVKVYQTLLRLAVYDMNREMVELLLSWNASIDAEDSDDETPLVVATDSTRYEDIPGSEKMRGITDCLVMYVAKLVSEGLHVSEQNLSLIRQKFRLQVFYEQCRAELANMRSKKIHNSVTYYDLLTKDPNTMARYARNESMSGAFESSDYANAFPIYSAMMRKNYERGRAKKLLLDAAEGALKFIFRGSAEGRVVPLELPYVVRREVLKYLGLKDLRVLALVPRPAPSATTRG
ncbi:uncharacterized protein LOC106637542 [Copidosoma floridanum]|uniref:uncharacterized protein LOC106637542 n=1 Tax=Copidosoma floridanum TaxID=29053 RepID=UPI0006C94D2A|nr:uncharacterized protein LOC106637542 [Copidosoma floridanum]